MMKTVTSCSFFSSMNTWHQLFFTLLMPSPLQTHSHTFYILLQFIRSVLFTCHFHRAGYCSSNDLDLYPESAWFESWAGHRLYWQDFCRFFTLSRQMPLKPTRYIRQLSCELVPVDQSQVTSGVHFCLCFSSWTLVGCVSHCRGPVPPDNLTTFTEATSSFQTLTHSHHMIFFTPK